MHCLLPYSEKQAEFDIISLTEFNSKPQFNVPVEKAAAEKMCVDYFRLSGKLTKTSVISSKIEFHSLT